MKLAYRVHLYEKEHDLFLQWLRIPGINLPISFSFRLHLHITIHSTNDGCQLILRGNSDEAMSDWVETIFMERKQMENFIKRLSNKRIFKMPGFSFGFNDYFDGEKVLDLVIETGYLD